VLLALLGLAAGFFERYLHSRLAWILSLTAIVVFLPLIGSLGWHDFIQRLVLAIPITVFWLLAIMHLFRANLLAYLVAFTFSSLAPDVAKYWHKTSPPLQHNALVAILTSLTLVLVLISLIRRQTSRSEPSDLT
jgi:hypothetical protein